MYDIFRSYGQILKWRNTTKDQLMNRVQNLTTLLKKQPDSTLVFYYFGHGGVFKDKPFENQIICVDSECVSKNCIIDLIRNSCDNRYVFVMDCVQNYHGKMKSLDDIGIHRVGDNNIEVDKQKYENSKNAVKKGVSFSKALQKELKINKQETDIVKILTKSIISGS
eukprot:UN27730